MPSRVLSERAQATEQRAAKRLPLTEGPTTEIDRRIFEILARAGQLGKYKTEIEPFLTESERAFLERRDQNECVCKRRSFLLIKLERWQRGRPVVKVLQRDLKGKLAMMIRKRMERGESFGQIAKSAGLSRTERRVLREYVLTDKKRTLEGAARAIGMKAVTVSRCLRSSEDKFNGRPWYYHLQRKYLRMSDEKLEAEIEKSRAKTRTELEHRNYGLYTVARDRGVLDRLMPKKNYLPRLRKTAESALRKRSMAEICSDLRPIEVTVLLERALSDTPRGFEYFKEAYGLGYPSDLTAIEGRILGTMKERNRRKQQWEKLRDLVSGIGPEAMADIMKMLSTNERIIIERRTGAKKPERFTSIGERIGVSRQRAQQIEKRLVEKLRDVVPKKDIYIMDLPDDGWLRKLHVVMHAADPERMKVLRFQLDSEEIELLERRVYTEEPETLHSISVRWRKPLSAVELKERGLIRKLA